MRNHEISEYAIISGLLTDPWKARLWDICEFLSPNDFFTEFNGQIYSKYMLATTCFFSDIKDINGMTRFVFSEFTREKSEEQIKDIKIKLRFIKESCLTPIQSYHAAIDLKQMSIENKVMELMNEYAYIKGLQ